MYDRIRQRGFALDKRCVLWMPFYRYGTEQSRSWDYGLDNLVGAATTALPVDFGWYFDGAAARVEHASTLLGKTHTMHYWIQRDGAAAGVLHGGADEYVVQITDTTVGYSSAPGGIVAVTHNGEASTAKKTLISVQRVIDKIDFFQDGVQIGTQQTLPVVDNMTITDIGRQTTPGDYFEGIIYEAVVFSGAEGAVKIRNFFERTRRIQGI
jgi:hypothetical protein